MMMMMMDVMWCEESRCLAAEKHVWEWVCDLLALVFEREESPVENLLVILGAYVVGRGLDESTYWFCRAGWFMLVQTVSRCGLPINLSAFWFGSFSFSFSRL